jgi:diaminohydroxyphosphoribosylaminopyrimidine deaminase/5-amino-6-(5-phosphoribosylamino)uracil reductase
VAASADPNPRVDGRGFHRLRASGILVEVGVGEAEARALNRAFFTFMKTGRPHVTLKSAMTLDGKIAGADGTSRWVTGEAARAEAHRLRFAADAVLVGIGTVLQDDPQLTVRVPDLPAKEPLRIVADSRLRTPPDARVVTAGDPSRTLVACVGPAPAPSAAALRARGVRVLEMPADGGRVDLGALLVALAGLEVVGVLAEGGAELGAGLLDADLVDRIAFFVAPRLLGGRSAPGPIGGSGRALKAAIALTGMSRRLVGEDPLVEGDVVRDRVT